MNRTSIYFSLYVGLIAATLFWTYGNAQDTHVYDKYVSPSSSSISINDVQSAGAITVDRGKTPLSSGTRVAHTVAVDSSSVSAAAQNGTIPGLNLFYGLNQEFGHIGNPQRAVNILGNYVTTGGFDSLVYSLNGGPSNPTAIGPDRRRLTNPGDFNIELPYEDLNDGANDLIITGTEQNGNVTVLTMTVNYESGNEWPLPYTADWSNATQISDVAQVVDGFWSLTDSGVRPQVFSYDRAIGIGDRNWQDYEIEVPVTVYGIDELKGYNFPSLGPGVGILMNWEGHFQQTNELPFTGWQEFGALGFYRWQRDSDDVVTAGHQLLTYYGNEVDTNPDLVLEYEVPYVIKMSTQLQPSGLVLYRYKMWEQDGPEPFEWTMEALGDPNGPTNGSTLLLAHHVDLEFGTFNARPLSAIQPKVNLTTTGNGNVTIEPALASYSYGQAITLTASAPVGELVEWGGALDGNVSVQHLILTGDVDVAANFVTGEPQALDFSVVGSGEIVVTPNQATYPLGSVVTLTAVSDDGHIFTEWGGTVSGQQNPLQYVVTLDKSISATFIDRSTLSPPISDDFNGCAIDDSLWTVSDSLGDSTIEQNGSQLTIFLPGASDHDLWAGKNFAPRIMQPGLDGDFEAEVKFQSIPSQRFQMQGLIVEQDEDDYIRFDVFHDGTELRLFAAIFDSTRVNPNVRYNQPLATPSGSDILIRVQHFGTKWRLYYSFDETNWVGPVVTIDHPITVNQIGVFGGNTGDDVESVPAHNVIVDYFHNSLMPITPEDYKQSGVLVDMTGTGTGTIDVSSPQQGSSYACGETITLTAEADASARFVGWSGPGINSSDNPLTLSANGVTQSVVAEFEQTEQKMYMPVIIR